jgi:WD40 repeat protein
LLGYSPDGKLLLDAKAAIEQADPATGKTIRSFMLYPNGVSKAALGNYPRLTVVCSRGGKMMASGDSDWTIRLWSLESGKELRRFQPNPEHVVGLEFSPDGRLLVSSDLWDAWALVWKVR